MSTINALMKKRAKLEAQILEAQRREKRKSELVALLERSGFFALSDEQVSHLLSALQPKSAQPQPTNYTTNGGTP